MAPDLSITDDAHNNIHQTTISAAISALQTEVSIQELVPHLCLFIYQQIRGNTLNINILNVLMRYGYWIFEITFIL